ncbi:hypothetical protein QBA36_43005 [Streptomyces stelliscabiei]
MAVAAKQQVQHGQVMPPASSCAMLANGSASSRTPVMELSSVTMVITDWISAPVARVAMKESTRSATTTIPLTTPISSAAVIARAIAAAGPRSVETRK